MTKRERIYHNNKLRSSIMTFPISTHPFDAEKMKRCFLDEFSMWDTGSFTLNPPCTIKSTFTRTTYPNFIPND